MASADQGIASNLADAASRLVGRTLRPEELLRGGEHAQTCAVTDGQEHFVVRRFPPGDEAVRHEVEILGSLRHLEPLVPRLVAADPDGAGEGPLIVTTRLPGSHPAPTLAPSVLAHGLAQALGEIHRSDGAGLRRASTRPPQGAGPLSVAARDLPEPRSGAELVLTHYDVWSGNTLWVGERLSGIVDWSGARRAPRGQDVAWCRLDLVLLHGVATAETFLADYEESAGVALDDVASWDLLAAAHAEDQIEDWAPNYAGIGRADLTPARLRERLTRWGTLLLEGSRPR